MPAAKGKTVEKEIFYDPINIIDWNHTARIYGFSLNHPYSITVREGRAFIKGVEREQKPKERKGTTPVTKPGRKVEIEEV